ncbi:MAG: tRNA (adenosine(37)-N6)-threonylcarbamoyltransferase complex transferase subunit TsaD [Bacteroidales bacterium]
MSDIILGIESSCDDTSAAVISDGTIMSNIIAGQEVHRKYGGVVPELASRAHQQNIVPVVDTALREAGFSAGDISAVGFTRGPGLMGSLLVGTSFSKGLSLAAGIPLIEVNHLQAHVLAHFIKDPGKIVDVPSFPFICLLVSGGHTQIILVRDHLSMEILGQTIDDAAGEAFDKCAKVMGLPYPGGPWVDKYAVNGNPLAFSFSRPLAGGFNYSFSGLKTSFLYFLRDHEKKEPGFTARNINDLCASLQYTIVEILLGNLISASRKTGINRIALAGGVAANSGLRRAAESYGNTEGWKVFLPELCYTTDNAAMIAITAYYKYLNKEFSSQNTVPDARFSFGL